MTIEPIRPKSAQEKLAVLEQLKDIAQILTKEETDFLELHQAIKSYRSLLDGIVDIEYEGIYENENIQFNNGFALGTSWAARCLDEILRTKRFVRGLYLAILDLQSEGKKPIPILYAGCGPFGTLILPLLALLPPSSIQVKVLEVNSRTLRLFQKVIQYFEFQDYIIDYDLVDATKYHLSDNENYDILLTETMQVGLQNEQHVSVVINLMQQMEDCILIPEKIKLEAALMRNELITKGRLLNHKWKCFPLGTFFELSKKYLKTYELDHWNSEEFQFPSQIYSIPHDELENYDHLAVLTEITVYKEEVLKLNDCGLSLPIMLHQIDDSFNHKEQIEIYYKIDQVPRSDFKLI